MDLNNDDTLMAAMRRYTAKGAYAASPDDYKDVSAWLSDINDDIASADAYDVYAAALALDAYKDRVAGASRRTAWYDETDYIVPSKGLPAWRFQNALYDAWRTPNTGWSVGGYSTPRVSDNGDGTLTVTSVYHIGD